MTADGGLAAWAERSGRDRLGGPARGSLRFVFYGRVSTEDWQDPVTSRARQRAQAQVLVRGHGQVVAEFFDIGESRAVAWARRPQAAALVAALADPGRGWDAIVVGEYERAFYGSQYALMAPPECARWSLSGSEDAGKSRGSRRSDDPNQVTASTEAKAHDDGNDREPDDDGEADPLVDAEG
jgi:hypothetical protein